MAGTAGEFQINARLSEKAVNEGLRMTNWILMK
jgi:hypothetical protein